MKLRNALLASVLIIAAFLAGAAATSLLFDHGRGESGPAISESPPASVDEPHTWYTCGMHPEVIQDHPGPCPKCGMALTPMDPDRAAALGLAGAGSVRKEEGERRILYWRSSVVPGELRDEPGSDSTGRDLVPVYADEVAGATIRIDPVTEQNMAVRIDQVIRGPLVKTVRTVGQVAYDETTLASINTKVEGWIEKLHVDQTGAQLHRGDPLFEIYAPVLVAAQEEFISALSARRSVEGLVLPGAVLDRESLARDARARLRNLDVSEAQIRELERSRKVRRTLTVHARYTGIVTEKDVVVGERVDAGAELFRIADLSKVWVLAKVYESDLPFVRVDQEAFMTLAYLPGKTFRGRVTYVYPYLDEDTREISVRIEFHNPGYELKPGMFATVNLTSEFGQEATLVPDVAVIQTGVRAVAFVMREPGRYEAREVSVGARVADNYLQVLGGLAPGESVVVSGQFLLDSESRLREAALKFMPGGRVDTAQPMRPRAGDASLPSATEGDSGDVGTLHYVCPMPEHVDVLFDEPGTCPLCGMALVPARQHLGHLEPPVVTHWTCPMPEHASVRAPAAGTCPLCGMALVPVTRTAGAAKDDHGQQH